MTSSSPAETSASPEMDRLNTIVDAVARGAFAGHAGRGADVTRDFAKAIQDASRTAVESAAFRDAMDKWISKHLSEVLKDLQVLVRSRGKKFRPGLPPDGFFHFFPRALFSRIRAASVAVLTELAPNHPVFHSLDYQKVLDPHLDAIQKDQQVVCEISALVLRRIAKISQELDAAERSVPKNETTSG